MSATCRFAICSVHFHSKNPLHHHRTGSKIQVRSKFDGSTKIIASVDYNRMQWFFFSFSDLQSLIYTVIVFIFCMDHVIANLKKKIDGITLAKYETKNCPYVATLKSNNYKLATTNWFKHVAYFYIQFNSEKVKG